MKKVAKPGDAVSIRIGIKENHCACGSGKPAKDCCNRNAIKHVELGLSVTDYNSSDGLAISPSGDVKRWVNGKLKPLTGRGRLTISNRRDGKRDKLTAAAIAGTDHSLNPDLQLFQFEHALVIDTNSRSDGTATRCATGIFQIDPKAKTRETASLGYKPALTIEFIQPTLSPERIGWLFAIDAIKNSELLTGKRIALISDHDASRHDLLNSRSEKIDGRIKLPKNLRLIYAASDRGANAINKLMKKADQLASRVLKQGSIEDSSPWMDGSAYHCECYRLSYPDPTCGDWTISDSDSIKHSHHSDGF